MLFKDFMAINKEVLKAEMFWNNYGLNDVLLPVTDELKSHSLDLLTRNYGAFEVGEILEEIKADIFVNFPLLMQSLSISASMTYESVSRYDTEKETRILSEIGRDKNNSVETQNSQRDTKGTNVTQENNSSNSEAKNTGTVSTNETSQRSESNVVDATNASSTPMTGSKNVAITHAMPEQDISGTTGNFTRDSQGTPILNNSTVQNASENYSTVNQFQSTSDLDQKTEIENTIINDNLRTDNTTQITSNNVDVQSLNNATGNENLAGINTVEGTNETEHQTTERIERKLANKQYPFEVSKFLESINTVKSFSKWVDSFAWLCGVL